MKTYVITGGIGSGKSAVADFIREQGFPVLDADQVAREVVLPGSKGLESIVSTFGASFMLADGTLDRTALRKHISLHPEAQKLIGEILHPLIIQTIQNRLHHLSGEGHQAAFVEAALTLESGSYRHYDGVILVTAPEAIRLKRIFERDGVAPEEAKALMNKQMSDTEKRKLSDFEFENKGHLSDLKERVLGWLEQYVNT